MTGKKASFGRLFLARTGGDALKGVIPLSVNPVPEPGKPKLVVRDREVIRVRLRRFCLASRAERPIHLSVAG
jgi:hypothetical protein